MTRSSGARSSSASDGMLQPLEPRRLMHLFSEPYLFPANTPTGPTVVVDGGGSFERPAPFAERQTADGGWVSRRYSGTIDDAARFTAFTDPKNGEAYVIAFGDLTTAGGDSAAGIVYRQLPDGSLTDEQVVHTNRTEAIREGIIAFVSSDNRVHVAGLNNAGGVVMFYQTGARNADGTWAWAADNLSQNHFFPQNITPPVWSSAPTAYVTPWGGLNIAVIDEHGDLQVMWWAPGKKYWSADNLSVIAGLPMLDYLRAPTSYVTPWGGQNVGGLTRGREVVVAWWAPATDTWSAVNMTKDYGGSQLDSVTAYVTAWGGLNIAGQEWETNRPVVYWWAPGMTAWTFERIELVDGSEPQVAAMAPLVRGGELNLFSLDNENGDVLRMSWRAGDTEWTLENLTELT